MTADREIVVSRLVDAPVELVFRAFTEPKHVIHWWGPFGFKTTITEMQVREGGRWCFTMHGPDGTDYPNEIRYLEVVPNERLVIKHGTGRAGDVGFDATFTFATEGTKTRVTLRNVLATVEQAVETKKYAVDGGNQTLTRMEAFVETMQERVTPAALDGATSGDADFVITRVFDAPRALLFKVMTEPEHLGKWFGPKGMDLRVISSSLKPGGEFRYAMKAGPNELFGKFVYREVTPPSRLVHVVSFTDAAGAPIRHPMSQTWPLEVLTINSLAELGNKTVYFGRSIPIRTTDEERQTFRAGHSGMVGGFKGTYDQLDVYLKTLV